MSVEIGTILFVAISKTPEEPQCLKWFYNSLLTAQTSLGNSKMHSIRQQKNQIFY